jgi:GTP-binding protein HflX
MSTPYNEALGATLIERTKANRSSGGVTFPGSTDSQTDASLDELALLIDTAGADEAGRLVQRRDTPDHTWFIGKAKLDELKDLCLAVDADTVVFENELSPTAVHLKKVPGRTAIDPAVILDIFAQNAHTLEGKAQVELAPCGVRLPRLSGAPAKLSQHVVEWGPGSAPARPSSKSIAGGSCVASASSSPSSRTCRRHDSYSARAEAAAVSRR